MAVTDFGLWPAAVLGSALMCASSIPVLLSPIRNLKEIVPTA